MPELRGRGPARTHAVHAVRAEGRRLPGTLAPAALGRAGVIFAVAFVSMLVGALIGGLSVAIAVGEDT